MEKQLPKNWVSDLLYNVLVPVKTGVKIYDGVKSYYSTGSVKDNGIFEEGIYDYYTKPSRANREVEIGDILQARMSYTDKALLVNENLKDSLFSTGFIQIRPFNKTINSKYVFYYLKSDFFHSQKDELASGTTQVAINDLNAKKIDFPIPPIAEQNRIVAKLDTLFAQLETIKTSMAKVPLLLKDFRQQVLTQAVTGKLTEEWRKGKKVEQWGKTKLNDVLPKGGIFDGPFGSNLKTEDYTDKGVRVIRLENIEHLYFIKDKETYISEKKHQTLLRHTVGEGDIIFSSFISENIRACILPQLKTNAIAKADCFCIRPDETIINKNFLLFILVSNSTYKQLTYHIHGATRPRINTTQLKTLIIPLVSLKEQQEIVSRVESLFAKADAIEKQYETLKAKIERLPQAILHKAFKGELTEQLDSDGDARELLREIEELKEAGKTLKSKKTKSVAKKV